MKSSEPGGAQPNQSLIDGIAVLQALALSSEPVGGRELARRLAMEPTRVNRLLKTLAYLNIAHQTASRKYTSGPGMTVLAAQSLFASKFIQNALPTLGAFRQFNHTVAMGVLWRDNVSYLYHAKPGMLETEAVGRIGLYPATQGGIGMALLSNLPDVQIENIYEGKDIPCFPNGVKSLLSRLRKVRKQGFADHNLGKHQRTVAICIGEPTFGAIGISGNISEDELPIIIAELREGASRIEGLSVGPKKNSPDTQQSTLRTTPPI